MKVLELPWESTVPVAAPTTAIVEVGGNALATNGMIGGLVEDNEGDNRVPVGVDVSTLANKVLDDKTPVV
jgi:hypothetical protein